jgi:hypothetical protein
MKRVNGARTRVIALGRVSYVGEDANGNVRKGTKETALLSIWCQRMTQAVSPVKAATRPRIGAVST